LFLHILCAFAPLREISPATAADTRTVPSLPIVPIVGLLRDADEMRMMPGGNVVHGPMLLRRHILVRNTPLGAHGH
jgi:hypothetical protein